MQSTRLGPLLSTLIVVVLVVAGCGDSGGDDPAAALYGTWATKLEPLGHKGFSHVTFTSDGSFKSDIEFVVAGSDCLLDRKSTGTFEADGTTVTLRTESGTNAVTQCTGENGGANHDERALTTKEIAESNIGELMWSIDGGVLTMTNGADIIRKYTPVK